VEDTAIVFDELAILARPGASSRRGETEAVAAALASHRPLARIDDPGTIDGGDVLVTGRAVFVGCSSRTNRAGIDQLARLLEPLAYRVTAVTIRQCLHLKSAVTALGDETLLVDRASLDPAALGLFRRFRIVESDPAEPSGANVARVGDALLASAASPRTRERLEKQGFRVAAVDVSELAKAEGAVTCCSLIFASGGMSRR